MLVTILVVGYLVMGYMDREGILFFDVGKRILATLDQLSEQAGKRNVDAMLSEYATDYRGTPLGLASMKPVEEKDGIHKLVFAGTGGSVGRQQAIEEWRAYLDSFASIEEISFHIHRLEQFRDANHEVATVRFEAIGKLQGQTRNMIDRGMFRFGFRDGPNGVVITSAELVSGERFTGDRPQFANVSHAAGIDFMNQFYPAFLNQPMKFGMIRYGPGGITTVDYDNDGFYDLFIPDGVASRLYRNMGDGHFEDVTAQAGLTGLDGVSVGVFADYDNDGYKDLFVSRTFKHNQLFHNNGDGTFTDVTARSGIKEDCCTTVASWADYDNDGLLDLYVGRYLDPRRAIPTTFYARNGESNTLYHNNGDGTFTDVTAKAGVGDPGLCLGTVFGDYDGDGYPDLYVVNDFGRKTLYHNNRDGTFTDVTVKTGTLAYGAGMSASMVDYNNDGRLDIYCTNIRSEDAWFASPQTVNRYMVNCWRQGVWKSDMPLYWQVFRQSGTNFAGVFQQMASGNTLMRNNGKGGFDDVTVAANANPVGWYWGASFADFDNDGWQDAYMADGWVYNDRGTEIELDFLNNVVSHQDIYKTGLYFSPAYFGRLSWHGWERNRLLRNRGDGTFEEIATPAGTDLIENSRGVAVADFWNRGVMDIAVSASTDRHALFRNEVGGSRHWLEVELVGTRSNRDAVGARVSIKVNGKPQIREVVLGDGYGSQNSLRQHFGLGESAVIQELTVKWPRSGVVQTFHNVAGDRILEITEGKDQPVEKHYTRVAVK
ncbi:MAG: CRTAC1 family protein [Acidobacteria bacterium]|nr:CRTAC1 family protein [Acidobacteriota bacterium]